MNKRALKIVSVIYLGDYELKLTFLDGNVSTINFFNFLNSTSNPEIKAYLSLDKFKSFKIKDGELMWGDFDLLFPIQDLYAGKISA
jgi:hypothetical protein